MRCWCKGISVYKERVWLLKFSLLIPINLFSLITWRFWRNRFLELSVSFIFSQKGGGACISCCHLKLEVLLNLENNLTSEEKRKLYNYYKNESETIYDHIDDDIRIRSKYEWYEHGQKSTNFFLNLEKNWGVQNKIR